MKIEIKNLPEIYKDSILILNEKLIEFNNENNTQYEITHNGLELWINFGEPQNIDIDTYDKIYKIVKNNNFSNCSIYGYKYVGIILGEPDSKELIK